MQTVVERRVFSVASGMGLRICLCHLNDIIEHMLKLQTAKRLKNVEKKMGHLELIVVIVVKWNSLNLQ